jgi:DNA repair exonuclease SbcCD ATPase subunit
MKIELISLKLENFKGIRNQRIDFTEKTNISGQNATGKTTIFDAFTWLLFGKDSKDKKDFGIKTYDMHGKTIEGIEHSVEGTINISGIRYELKKIYREKWTKEKGKKIKRFSGNETIYYIDEEEVSKGKYTEFIKTFVEENLFKLITNPHYFNEKLHWKERRDILMSIVGEISDDDVINSSDELKDLKNLLKGKGIESFKNITAGQRKKLNRELKEIPVRIDEANKTLPKAVLSNEDVLNANIDKIQLEIEEKNRQIDDQSLVFQAFNEKQREYYQAQNKVQSKEYELKTQSERPLQEAKMELREKERMLELKTRDINNNNQLIEKNNEKIVAYENQCSELRDQWFEVNTRSFESKDDFTCPTCGQLLPEEERAEKLKTMEDNFYAQKQRDLDRITKDGTDKKESISHLESDNEKCLEVVEGLTNESEILKSEIETIKANIENFVPGEIAEDDELKNLKEHVSILEKEIKKPDDAEINKLRAEIDTLKKKQHELNAEIKEIRRCEETQARIEELKDREKYLGEQIANLENHEELCDEFVRQKVVMIEEIANKKFQKARFRLFNTLVNGGTEESCDVTFFGVPYNDLNSAAKIEVGLDIIETLMNHYDIKAPIFIDNKESINHVPVIDTQTINLIVSFDEDLIIENITA